MKYLLKSLLWLLPICLLFGCAKTEAKPEKPEPEPKKATIIYIVRHAEKSSNTAADPDLSAAGKARAEALKDTLNTKPVSAVFSTSYERTRQTAEPVAKARNLNITAYDPGNLEALATKILKENLNQNVLIVGHSNTVLETIEAFNAQRPVPLVNESDYNYLFKITIAENGEAKAEVSRYGH